MCGEQCQSCSRQAEGHAQSLSLLTSNTIDHHTLLECLRQRFALDGFVLAWLKSYLTELRRGVVGDVSSGSLSLDTGIPQGSVLAPLLYFLKVQPLGDIVPCHGLPFHQFADDLQLHLTFDLSTDSLSAPLGKTELCLAEIKNWLIVNSLSMNDEKAESRPIAMWGFMAQW